MGMEFWDSSAKLQDALPGLIVRVPYSSVFQMPLVMVSYDGTCQSLRILTGDQTKRLRKIGGRQDKAFSIARAARSLIPGMTCE
jgi:hypothetical protein